MNLDLNVRNYRGQDWSGKDLRGCDLVEARLDYARLVGARANSKTVWPAGFDWRAAGVIMVED